jgi:deoxyhypusine synthase
MLGQQDNAPPSSATNAVLVASEPVPEGTHKVSGVDFEKYQGRDITVAEMVDNMKHMGFQSSAVADAARIINEMVIHRFLELAFTTSANQRCRFQSAPIGILRPATKPQSSSATHPT